MNGNPTTVHRRAGPRGRSRADGVVPAATLIASVLLAVFLAWIHPALLVLVAVVCGIGWLRRSDADPVHWGPVPRSAAAAGPVAPPPAGPRAEATGDTAEEPHTRTPSAPSPTPGRVVTTGRSGQRPPSGPVRRSAGTARHDGATARRRATRRSPSAASR